MAALAAQLPASAQTIDFETGEGFSRLGVYDTWEQSPFRTGAIASPERYVGITDNPDTSVNEELDIQPNPSEKVLAVQRSRFGSNTFGARIDLADTLHMTTATRYVHVMVLKPQGETANVMVIGLGKRRDWKQQSPATEQFWEASSSTLNDGSWTDLVFPISTNEYVDIHSLVLVPDLASPHLRTSDFVAYFDDIEVNDNPKPRIMTSFYPVNFDADQKPTRTDRALNSVTIKATGEKTQTVSIDKTKVYNNQVETKTITARPGSTVSIKMSYTGAWMSGYAYVDWDNDGQFKPDIEDNKPAAGSELVSYTYLGGYNSLGQSQSSGNSVSGGYITCPTFTIPEDTPFGIYRMRLKVDWDSDDAGGNADPNNLIVSNGGAILDVLLNVHPEEVDISANQLNGDVLADDGTVLSEKRIPFGQVFKIKMAPAPDFTYTGAVITHGYNLDGPEYVRDNRQYKSITIPASSFNSETHEYSIPASYIDGEVRIEGLFTPGENPDPGTVTPKYKVTYKKDADGAFYQNGSEVEVGNGWAAAEWISAGPEPVVTIKSDRNNGFNTTNFNLGRDYKFTISVGSDYSISGYKISTTDGWGTTIVTEGNQTEVFSGTKELTVSDLATTSTWFTTADANLNGPMIDVYLMDANSVGISQPAINVASDDSVYSINGRRVVNPSKGLYIVNDRKVIIR